jgi:hypothetical protein
VIVALDSVDGGLLMIRFAKVEDLLDRVALAMADGRAAN